MVPTNQSQSVTGLLQSWSQGDRSALDQLTPLVHAELRRLAASYLRRERRDHTLQPTALVHEAYLRLVDQTCVGSTSRAHFFGIAAKLMRQILVNHARHHRAAKRGGGNKIGLDQVNPGIPPREADLLALDEALDRLAQIGKAESWNCDSSAA